MERNEADKDQMNDPMSDKKIWGLHVDLWGPWLIPRLLSSFFCICTNGFLHVALSTFSQLKVPFSNSTKSNKQCSKRKLSQYLIGMELTELCIILDAFIISGITPTFLRVCFFKKCKISKRILLHVKDFSRIL